jgi:hypothetical protein
MEKKQYLRVEEWNSLHLIVEKVQYLRTRAQARDREARTGRVCYLLEPR